MNCKEEVSFTSFGDIGTYGVKGAISSIDHYLKTIEISFFFIEEIN